MLPYSARYKQQQWTTTTKPQGIQKTGQKRVEPAPVQSSDVVKSTKVQSKSESLRTESKSSLSMSESTRVNYKNRINCF